jgi:hypothetical protein
VLAAISKLYRVTILVAFLFATLSLLPMLAPYLMTETGLTFPDDPPTRSSVEVVSAVKEFAELRQMCLRMAEHSDRFGEYIRWNATTSKLITWATYGMLVFWSGLAIMGFLYVAWQLRRLRNGVSGSALTEGMRNARL